MCHEARRRQTKELNGALRKNDLVGALEIYHAMLRSGLPPVALGTYNYLLHMCVLENRFDEAESIFHQISAAGSRPDEGSYCILIRAAVVSQDFTTAFRIIRSMVDRGVKSRLRSYAPLLEALSCPQNPNVLMAMEVWDYMMAQPVHPQEDQVVSLLSMLLSRYVDEPFPASIRAGNLWAAVDELLQHLSTVSLHVSRESAEKLAVALEKAAQHRRGEGCLGRIVALSPAGQCPQCSLGLEVLGLSAEERRAMRSRLLAQAASTDVDQTHDLAEFARWLENRPRFTVAIDAANVAYCRQNHSTGRFSFVQIDMVYRALVASGERPLIVIHKKYLKDNIPNHSVGGHQASFRLDVKQASNRTRQQLVSRDENTLRQCWRGDDVIFSPRFSWADDDWYWMYFTVAYPDTAKPSFVITNDETRDHRMGLLEPRAFGRWRSTHVKNFDFR